MKNFRVQPGTLLASWPDLLDPNFMHRVVLLCEHGEEGAYGLVVNRPTEFTTRELFVEHPTLGSVDFPIHLGGPVDHSHLQIVHSLPDEIPGGIPLGAGIHLGGELEAVGAIIARDPEAALGRVRLLVGYSGWGAGQLEVELQTGSWVPARATPAAVFGAEQERTWRDVIRSVDGGSQGLEELPPDVRWN